MLKAKPKEQLCPLRCKYSQDEFSQGDTEDAECERGRCAFWVHTYTTEGISCEMCAIAAIALKNADGKITV